MAKKTNRLGKGLSALITTRPEATPPATESGSASSPARDLFRIPVDDVSPNPRQPRTSFDEQALAELAESIRAKGLLQPIVVRQLAEGKYELIAGERRLRASRLAGLETIPAVIRDVDDAESVQLALIENLQRQDLGPIERASAYQQYLEVFGGSIEDLARNLSESRANVSNYLRLLNLHPEVCFMLGGGELGMGQARALAGLTDHQRQLALARLAIRRNLSVRQVEDLVRQATETAETAPPSAPVAAQRQHLEGVASALTKALGLQVRLRPGRKKNSGRIVISYNSLDDFDRVAERLGGSTHLE